MSSVHVLSNTYFMNTDDSNMIQLRTAGRSERSWPAKNPQSSPCPWILNHTSRVSACPTWSGPWGSPYSALLPGLNAALEISRIRQFELPNFLKYQKALLHLLQDYPISHQTWALALHRPGILHDQGPPMTHAGLRKDSVSSLITPTFVFTLVTHSSPSSFKWQLSLEPQKNSTRQLLMVDLYW